MLPKLCWGPSSANQKCPVLVLCFQVPMKGNISEHFNCSNRTDTSPTEFLVEHRTLTEIKTEALESGLTFIWPNTRRLCSHGTSLTLGLHLPHCSQSRWFTWLCCIFVSQQLTQHWEQFLPPGSCPSGLRHPAAANLPRYVNKDNVISVYKGQ